jgi:UDP-N-acetylglucosamine--N-acetylmuramyl-(pentapeptide) pyrophosphoryl-undecaprenol N-acetylglucosamine transferase
LIFGGSQVSRAINLAVVSALSLLAPVLDRLVITHQTGEADLEMVKEGYAEAGFDADIRPFINEMAKAFERSDVLICRAGATTAAEVAAAGKAAIFVPFPFAADNHQRKNAEAFERAGAARMIVQTDLTPETLAKELRQLIEHPEEIDRMEEASRKLGRVDSAERTVDLALLVASGASIGG